MRVDDVVVNDPKMTVAVTGASVKISLGKKKHGLLLTRS